jgi:hypothetical protein
MKNITTEQVSALIAMTQNGSGKGQLFTVTFHKKDGTLRTMRARLGMQRNLTGRGMSYNPASKGLVTVWSADKQGYRTVKLDKVVSLSLRDRTSHRRETFNVAS